VPAPRDSRLIPDAYECRGMPEARMHGVGETPPVGVNGDRTAELASGSRVGVSYRVPDRRSSAADQEANRDTDLGWVTRPRLRYRDSASDS
jgi:hypothetical protein